MSVLSIATRTLCFPQIIVLSITFVTVLIGLLLFYRPVIDYWSHIFDSWYTKFSLSSPSSKSCVVKNSTLQTRGQGKQGAPQNKKITFNNNLHKHKSEAVWAGAPSAGILSTDCLHRGAAHFGCSHTSMGTHGFIALRGHSGQGSLSPCHHGAWDMAASPGGDVGSGSSASFLHQRVARARRAPRAGVQPCQPCSPPMCTGSTQGAQRVQTHTPRNFSASSPTGLCIPCAPTSPQPEHGGNSQPLLEFASAGEASISAKPVAFYSAIAFPNSTFFAFWVPLTLPEGLPWAEENTFLQGWLAARRIKYVYFFSARYPKYSPCKASFHCLSCLTVRRHLHMFSFPRLAAASPVCVQISCHRHSTEDRRAQAAVEKSWLAWRSPWLGASAGAKSNFLHSHILYLIVTG